MMLYKYFNCRDYNFEALRLRKLWKSSPSSFNDPFECRLMDVNGLDISNIPGIQKMRIENPDLLLLSDIEVCNTLIERYQNRFEEIKIISFTEVRDDILMWAHYTQNHEGFCLGFNVDPGQSLIKVIYSEDYPPISFDPIMNVQNGLMRILVCKSIHWSYEKEWRRVFTTSSNRYSDYPGILKEVICGARMSDLNKRIIRMLIDESLIEIKTALLHPNKFELLIS